MKKYILSISFFLSLLSFTYAQEKYLTKSGHIDFFSETKIEVIKADNDQVLSIVDLDKNEIVIHALMKSFLFEKSLMQEHFNEDYIESNKYPKAVFKGKIIGFDLVNKLEQKIIIEGELSLRGKIKKIRFTSIMFLKENVLVVKGSFNVSLTDFNIKPPSSTINSIAETIKISFDIKHNKYEK